MKNDNTVKQYEEDNGPIIEDVSEDDEEVRFCCDDYYINVFLLMTYFSNHCITL